MKVLTDDERIEQLTHEGAKEGTEAHRIHEPHGQQQVVAQERYGGPPQP